MDFKPKLRQLVVSGLVLLACLIGTASLGGTHHDSFWWILAHDTVQAIGAIAAAFGGLGGLITVLAQRRWQRELQVIAVDVLDEAIHHAGAIGQLATFILFGDTPAAQPLAHTFDLPWTFVADDVIAETKTQLAQSYRSLSGAPDPAIVVRLGKSSVELINRCSQIRVIARELDGYLQDATPVIGLVADVAELNRKVRVLTAGSHLLPARQPSAATTAAYEVLQKSIEVALGIRAPFEQIRANLRDNSLRAQLVEQEQKLRQDEWFRRSLAEGQALTDQLKELAAKRAEMVKEAATSAQQASDLATAFDQEKTTARSDSDMALFDLLTSRFNLISETFLNVSEVLGKRTVVHGPESSSADDGPQ